MVAKRLANGTSLAHYLYEAVPWSRWIVLMRDPVSRYYSAYYYYRYGPLHEVQVFTC